MAGVTRSLTRLRRSILLGAVFLGGTAAPAAAHFVYEYPWTYFSSNSCEQTRSEVSHGGGGGYYKTDGVSYRENRAIQASCAEWFDRPAGYKAAKWAAWKWNGSQWALCQESNYSYNSSTTSRHVVYWDYGSRTPCGNGYYGNMGTSYHYNGAWYGGSVWSGYHQLPA